jgi:hypothetical protein
MTEAIMSSSIFIIFALLMITGLISEIRIWNNGICKKTGEPWVSFDVDSQGGRGYSSGDQTCWISYPGVDRVRKPTLQTRYKLLRDGKK